MKLDPSKLCQEFTDSLKDKGYSVRYMNACQAFLKTFFKVNGFEGGRVLKVDRYYQSTRYRKKPEYIPTSEEIHNMGFASGLAKNRAIMFKSLDFPEDGIKRIEEALTKCATVDEAMDGVRKLNLDSHRTTYDTMAD